MHNVCLPPGKATWRRKGRWNSSYDADASGLAAWCGADLENVAAAAIRHSSERLSLKELNLVISHTLSNMLPSSAHFSVKCPKASSMVYMWGGSFNLPISKEFTKRLTVSKLTDISISGELAG